MWVRDILAPLRESSPTTESYESYDAFISYSQNTDGPLARRVHRDLEQFGRPWYQRRARRIFLDHTNLTGSPDLGRSIEDALGRSEWFLLLASPESAASPWVRRELEWWLDHKRPDRILVGLTAGEIAWHADDRTMDTDRTTALPAGPFVGRGLPEPLWIDFRAVTRPPASEDPELRTSVLNVVTALGNLPKDQVLGEDIRQQRRRRRWIVGATMTLVALTIASLAGAGVATYQGARANEQTTIVTARQLASVADSDVDNRLDLSRLLASSAYRLRPDSRSYAALLRADSANAQLTGFVPTGSAVGALGVSTDHRRFAYATADGAAAIVDGRSDRVLFSAAALPSGTAVATDPGARFLAVAADHDLQLWNTRTSTQLTRHSDDPIAQVALSGTGDRLAVAYSGARADSTQTDSTQTVSRIDLLDTDLHVLASRRIDLAVFPDTPADQRATVRLAFGPGSLNLASGSCDRYSYRFDSLADVSHYADCGLPVNGYITASSPSAQTTGFFINGDSVVFGDGRTDGSLFGRTPGSNDVDRFAISDDRRRIVLMQDDALVVSDLGPDSNRDSPSVTLHGASGFTAAEFLGSDRLVSAAAGGVQIWDLTATGTIARISDAAVPQFVGFADRPPMKSSPVGLVAVAEESAAGDNAVLVVDPSTGRLLSRFPVDDLALPVAISWSDGGDSLTAVGNLGQSRTWRIGTPGPGVDTPPLPESLGFQQLSDVGETPDGTILLIDVDGDVVARRPDGSVVNSYRRPRVESTYPIIAKVGPGGAYGVHAQGSAVDVLDTTTWTARSVDIGGTPTSMTFLDRAALLVGLPDGRTDVVDLDRGTTTPFVRAGAGANFDAVAPGPGLVATLELNGVVQLTAYPSGEPRGEIDLNAGAPGRFSSATEIGLVLSADGKTLVTASPTHGVVAWTLDPQELVAIACRSVHRDLTADEWTSLVGTDPPSDLGCGH